MVWFQSYQFSYMEIIYAHSKSSVFKKRKNSNKNVNLLHLHSVKQITECEFVFSNPLFTQVSHRWLFQTLYFYVPTITKAGGLLPKISHRKLSWPSKVLFKCLWGDCWGWEVGNGVRELNGNGKKYNKVYMKKCLCTLGNRRCYLIGFCWIFFCSRIRIQAEWL